MSRGLGKLQRQILDTLAIAKDECQTYSGSHQYEDSADEIGHYLFKKFRYHVNFVGSVFKLPDDVFDLRASLRYLAEANDKMFIRCYVSPEFQANFSQAVRRLVKGGYLDVPLYIKITELIPPWGSLDGGGRNNIYFNESEGLVCFCNTNQTRFVKVGVKSYRYS
jgi:hypothetical protein